MENGRASAHMTKQDAPGSGPFVLRTLLEDVPLSAEPGRQEDIRINCVEYLDRNLYVGTSASELLHFVQIPPEPSDPSGSAVFIQALRLRPAFAEPPGVPAASLPGVQQILLLPRVGKACILCNWTVTFYSLPELTPVFNNTQVSKCNWVGGVDLNDDAAAGAAASGSGDQGANGQKGVTVLLSLNRRIQAVRIGEKAHVVKNIDFAGSTVSVRRDSIACVADTRGYALLDVDRQLKIPLMSISSLDDSQEGTLGQVQNIAPSSEGGGLSRSASSAQQRTSAVPKDLQTHSRSTSLGGLISGSTRKLDKKAAEPEESIVHATGVLSSPKRGSSSGRFEEASPEPEPNGSDKPAPSNGSEETNPVVVEQTTPQVAPPVAPPKPKPPELLKPHIVSPSAEEFLLVTGTSPQDPGIGMFVNLDGDPTRPTVEFERYPREVVIDGGSSDLAASRRSLDSEEEGYVLASMARDFEDGVHQGIEIQRWDLNVGEGELQKFWLELSPRDAQNHDTDTPLGIRSLMHADDLLFAEVVDRLCQRRAALGSLEGAGKSTAALQQRKSDGNTASEKTNRKPQTSSDRGINNYTEPLPEGWELKRRAEEEDFVRRLAKVSSRLAVWSNNRIWWAARNPLILQLEAALERHSTGDQQLAGNEDALQHILALLGSFQGRDARTELEFLTFNYIRQRCGLLLLASFLLGAETRFAEGGVKLLEKILLESGLDARAVLALIPAFRPYIVESQKGVWIYGGVQRHLEALIQNRELAGLGETVSTMPERVLQFFRRFLGAWRGRKGLPSVTDEGEVFRTVDTVLVLVLLELDRKSPRGLPRTGSLRQELYELVDHGVDCFDTVVQLLEQYHRLYVLSRLYQGRKMSADVLAVWRRIVEGEADDGGELEDGEQRVREYLGKVSNPALVQGIRPLAREANPKLGVQVFTDGKGRAPKFEPAQVVDLLRNEAPDAVKYYLEHLVFGKGNTAYVNELISYYLNLVLEDLQSSEEARSNILASYEAYRALGPPKPTYRQFLTDNAPPDDEVWHSRLRLLQLLGGAHDYDAAGIRARIASAHPANDDTADHHQDRQQQQQLLVPETIILDGRERRHEDALRLLVHRLGDYDTAVAYCLRGGASIYLATPGRRDSMPTRAAQERLFGALLREFLALDDADARAEQTAALLEGFGGWFDVREVLELLPDGWRVGVAADFLVGALRRLVRERHESMVARGLSSAENLQVNYELLRMIDEKGPTTQSG